MVRPSRPQKSGKWRQLSRLVLSFINLNHGNHMLIATAINCMNAMVWLFYSCHVRRTANVGSLCSRNMHGRADKKKFTDQGYLANHFGAIKCKKSRRRISRQQYYAFTRVWFKWYEYSQLPDSFGGFLITGCLSRRSSQTDARHHHLHR